MEIEEKEWDEVDDHKEPKEEDSELSVQELAEEHLQAEAKKYQRSL